MSVLVWRHLPSKLGYSTFGMKRTSHPFKHWIKQAAKVAISVGLIWFAFRATDFTSLADRVMMLPGWLIAALLALIYVQTSTATWRWHLIAKANRIPLPFPAALRIFFIGQFFNQTLPSSVGGDIFRIWLLHRRGTSLGQATGNVILDRILGLEALLLTSLLGLPVVFSTVPGPAPWSILGLSLTGLVGFAILLALGGRYGAFLEQWRATSTIRNAALCAWRLVTHPMEGLAVLVLSVSVHLMAVFYIASILRGLGHDLPFAVLVALIPPVLLVTVLPISMAGWGVRESAMIFILGILGIPAADALATSLLFGIGVFLVGLPGGLLWLSRPEPNPADAETRQEDVPPS